MRGPEVTRTLVRGAVGRGGGGRFWSLAALASSQRQLIFRGTPLPAILPLCAWLAWSVPGTRGPRIIIILNLVAGWTTAERTGADPRLPGVFSASVVARRVGARVWANRVIRGGRSWVGHHGVGVSSSDCTRELLWGGSGRISPNDEKRAPGFFFPLLGRWIPLRHRGGPRESG